MTGFHHSTTPRRHVLPPQRLQFDYKMAWFERLLVHAASLLAADVPVVLAGDYNVVPTDADIYPTKSWAKDALLQPAPRRAFRRLLEQGWLDALRTQHPDDTIYTFWDCKRDRWQRNAGLRLDHILLSHSLGQRLVDAGVCRDVRGRRQRSCAGLGAASGCTCTSQARTAGALIVKTAGSQFRRGRPRIPARQRLIRAAPRRFGPSAAEP